MKKNNMQKVILKITNQIFILLINVQCWILNKNVRMAHLVKIEFQKNIVYKCKNLSL